MDIPTGQYLLILLSAWGVYAGYVFAVHNGNFDSWFYWKKREILPGTDERLRTNITGFMPLDEVLSFSIIYWWPLFDGSSPGLIIYVLNAGGETAAWATCMLLEYVREGNRGKIGLVISGLAVGQISAVVSLGVALPWVLWGLLSKSPTALRPNSGNMSVPAPHIWALPVSVIVGIFAPLLVVIGIKSSFTKQAAIVVWSLWPVFASIAQFGLSRLIRLFAPLSPHRGAHPNTQSQSTRAALRYAYSFAFACTAISHVISWTITLCASIWPALLNPVLATALRPDEIMLPPLPWSSARIESDAQGCIWFLQWDKQTAAIAVIVWVISLYRTAHASRGIEVNWLGVIVKIVLLGLVSGLGGVAVELMWEREELMLDTTPPASTKAKDKKEVSKS
ncbi:hypothetical protein AJ80_04555 [Polytolypa hystricis UAMH7299]|uniref:Uncharacterized protein n=1 Tax=Polytolypa hystricis (strain UAMH7299) TaxID=1447883 RepID=A0A2B7YB69_POLH7|nr:hypothetical protein AJ80_04555 [Polytolypa hystricis UAMH7299]